MIVVGLKGVYDKGLLKELQIVVVNDAIIEYHRHDL